MLRRYPSFVLCWEGGPPPPPCTLFLLVFMCDFSIFVFVFSFGGRDGEGRTQGTTEVEKGSVLTGARQTRSWRLPMGDCVAAPVTAGLSSAVTPDAATGLCHEVKYTSPPDSVLVSAERYRADLPVQDDACSRRRDDLSEQRGDAATNDNTDVAADLSTPANCLSCHRRHCPGDLIMVPVFSGHWGLAVPIRAVHGKVAPSW